MRKAISRHAAAGVTPSVGTLGSMGCIYPQPSFWLVLCIPTASIGPDRKWNCGSGAHHDTVTLLLMRQGIMFRAIGPVFLFAFMVLCAVQLLGMACADDCLREWSTSPLQAQDRIPAGTDGQTETDGSQGEGELELAPAYGHGYHVIPRMARCVFDSLDCPRSTFVSDWFRPPVRL